MFDKLQDRANILTRGICVQASDRIVRANRQGASQQYSDQLAIAEAGDIGNIVSLTKDLMAQVYFYRTNEVAELASHEYVRIGPRGLLVPQARNLMQELVEVEVVFVVPLRMARGGVGLLSRKMNIPRFINDAMSNDLFAAWLYRAPDAEEQRAEATPEENGSFTKVFVHRWHMSDEEDTNV